MNLFTIGFAQKSAEEFFTLLAKNNVTTLIDIRLSNQSQLAGFTHIKHLPYFLKLHNINYMYKPEFAPTKKLLDDYKSKTIDWQEYEKQYNRILIDRESSKKITIADYEDVALLCSEPAAMQCHRRLFAEYISKHFNDVKIKHL